MFKQKTAYEMRISDWSSDVCSSDLLCLDGAAVAIAHRDGRGQIAERDMILPKHLERRVGIHDLVVRIAVEELRRLVVEHFAQERGHRFALVEPLTADARERLSGQIGRASCRERVCQYV